MKLFPALRRSTITGYSVATVLLLLVGLASYQSLTRLLDHAAWVEHTHIVLRRLETVVSLMKDAETGQRGYLLTGDTTFLAPLRTAHRRTGPELHVLDSLTRDNAPQQQRLDTLRRLIATKYALMQANLTTYARNRQPSFEQLRLGKEQMDQLRGLIGRMQANEQQLLALRRQRADQYARYTHPLILAVSLLVAAGATWRLQRSRAAGQREQLESRTRFAQLLETIPHLTWTSQPNGTPNYYNQQWLDYTGASVTELVNGGVRSYIHPDDLDDTLAGWRQSLRTGEPLPETRLRLRQGRTGEYRWHLARAVPLRNMAGDIILWVGTNTDVHTQQLQQQQLERVNTDLDNFIYTASHDLKTPISNIEALLAELREELLLPPAQAEPAPLLDHMQQAVERFKRTIAHMTEVVKLQKAHDQPAAHLDLAGLIHEVCLDLAPQLAATGGQVDVDVAACPALAFSEKNLRSIVYNLLSNAVKYHHPERPPHVLVRCARAGSFAVLSVEDNGLGLSLDAAQEQKLFGLFKRLHDHVEGSGIGLYMVKKIIENAGGRIEVESQPGRGSTFRVYFPL